MNDQLETLRKIRKFLLELTNELTVEQLNEIPPVLIIILYGILRIWWPHNKEYVMYVPD